MELRPLDELARILFERCSVFMGGATLNHIEEICGPSDDLGAGILDALGTLVDSSLMRPTSTGGEPRYQMLVVVREFVHEALRARGTETEIRRRHSSVFAGLARGFAPQSAHE
ncbi:MAG: hypothetical protein V3S26_07995 [Acidimicrobiia bacterium]|jgi:predicted ATPase